MPTAKTFCPGHVTGFFEIRDSETDEVRRGSRGAGFCTSLGVVTEAAVEKSDTLAIDVLINGKPDDAPVTRKAISNLLGNASYSVKIDAEQQLPTGQGFGMSGAGAFGGALAVATALKLDHPFALAMIAAHSAEVSLGTGLGDVVGQAKGGFEIRLNQGVPPFGVLENFEGAGEVVLCVTGEPLDTKSVIGDSAARERINRHGSVAMDNLIETPSMEMFLELSYLFAHGTGLLSEASRRALESIKGSGKGSMVMLGNSIFAFGDLDEIEESLKKRGRVYRCKVEKTGARPI